MHVIDLAWQIHEGDKYGENNYMYHLWGVYNTAVRLYGEEWAKANEALLFLHDAMEDHPDCRELLLKEVGEEVVDLLDALNKNNFDSRGTYLAVLRDHFGGDVLKVKVADSTSNMQESLAAGNFRRIKKYASQLAYLMVSGEATPANVGEF